MQLLLIAKARICCKEAVGLWCQLTIAFNEFNVMLHHLHGFNLFAFKFSNYFFDCQLFLAIFNECLQNFTKFYKIH